MLVKCVNEKMEKARAKYLMRTFSNTSSKFRMKKIALGPVLAGIITAELETRTVPTLGNVILNWERFVDDPIGYVKNMVALIQYYQNFIVSILTYSLLTR